MKIVSLKNVTKTYKLDDVTVNALKGISLDIEEGDFITIAGPSGSGKSTLLNLISCIDTPTSGSIKIGGNDVSLLSDKAITQFRLEKMGFIFQSFNLIPTLSVYENIEFPLMIRNTMTKKERHNKIMSLIESVGLQDRILNKPSELSGGQRQRVAIARALVGDPIIVLADEPTANLDSVTGISIIELMKQKNKEMKTTFVFSTHDESIMNEARRAVFIKDGLLLEKGNV